MAKLTMKEREYLRIADEMLANDRKAQAGGGANSLTPAARTALQTHVQVYPQQGSVGARQLAGNSLAYAQQSPKNAQEVTLGLMSGNATRPSKGNISALDMNQLRQGTLDNETAMKILRDLGALNNTANARNRETISVVGTDYLKEQATTSKALVAASSAMDGIHMTGKRLAYPETAAKKEKAAQWRDFYDLYGYEKDVPLEVMLRAEAIANGTARTVRDFDLMDDETYDREYAALEEWYRGLDHFALTENPAEIAYESETGKWREMADMQSAELSRRETIERLTALATGNADYDTLSVYTDTYEAPTGIDRVFGNDAFVQGYDDQLRFMNTRPSYAEIELASEYSGVVRGYANAGYDYLTNDELAVYNVLYNTDKNAAAEYLEALSPDLLRRRAQVQYNYNTVIGENPITGTIASIGTIVESPGAAVATILGAALGEDDPNSYYYDPQRKQTAIRTAQAQLWGDMASFDVLGQPVGATIYNTLMSLGDMGMAYLTGGALAGGNAAFAQQAMGFIMSSEAAAGTLHEDLQRGFTAEQALLHGITNGAVEYLSEQIPLGELFSNEGKLAWRILKTGLSEGGEEIFSGTVQIGTDALFSYMSGRESEVETVYKEYAKTMSHEDAVRATLSHYAEEVALQGVTGFLSGGAMGTAAHTANDMQVRSYGESIMAEGDVDAMLNIAGGMRSDSQSAEWARRLTEKKNKGKKLSTYDVGRLTMAMESDQSAELAEAPNMVMDKAIEERLVELGEDSANAAKLASVIRKMYRGQKINPAARMGVRWDNNAEQVVKELSRDVAEEDMGRAGTEWAAGAKTNAAMATFEGTTRLFELGKAKGTIKETTPQEGAKAETPETVEAAASAAVEKSAAKVKVSKGTKVPNGKARAVLFGEDGSTVEGTSARFTEEGGKLVMTVDTADGTKTFPVENMQSTEDAGLAAVAQYVEDSNNNADGTHQMSAEEANAMMHVYEVEGGDAAKFISNFEKAYLDGYAGVEMSANGLSENAARIAYDMGKKEAEANETKRVQRTQEAKAASKGAVTWLGTVTTNEQASGRGSEEALAEAMEGMSESQRNTVEVVQAFAKEFKTNVVLFESDAENIGRIRNGSFEAETNTIYIDVNSGAYTAQDIQQQREQGTLGYAIMRTMGHELTHYLEYNSAEGYAKYKQAVKKALGNAGQDWATLVRSKIDVARRDGRKMTYAAAEAEVVADASEYMLQDSKFVEQIDNSVKSKIKRFIQNFMQKLHNAFRHLTEGHRESIALREMVDGVYHYTGDLQRLWDAAMEETMRRSESETEEAADEADYADFLKQEGVSTMEEFQEAIRKESMELNGDTRYSTRDNILNYASADNEDFHRDGRIYDYDFLVAQKPMRVVEIPSVKTLMSEGRFSRSEVVEAGKEGIPGAANAKGHKTVVNVYTNRDLTITNNSIRHGLNGSKQRLLANAQIGTTIGEVVKNGIPINGLNVTDGNAIQTYAMVTPCITEDGKRMMAVTHVDIQKNEVNNVTFTDIVHSANGRIYKNSEPVSNTIDVEGESPYHPSRYSISIADLLKDVNISFKSLLSQDVLEHLGEERPEIGTYSGKVLYSTRDLAGTIDIRDYLGNMKERPSMTETEKILLKRYQRTLGQLAEAEKKGAEQEAILRTATGDEITKTKNRIKIYRGQANRISRELLAMENDTGFARLMATSQEVLNRYLLGSAGNVADAADALDEEVKGLTKQLKAVEADVTRTSQAQRTAFARGLFDQQTLNRAAQKLKDAYGSRMSVKAIADRLALVYGEIYADNGAEGAKRFAEAAKELAYDILQGHKYRYKSETLPMLAEKIGTISLTETDVQEIKNAGMTISEYKKALAPWVKIAEGASDLSSVASNAMYYGDGALAAILGDDTEGNLAMNLYNYIQQEKAREQEIGVEGMSEGEMITAVMADIAGSDLPLSTNSKTTEYLRNEMKKFAGESAVAAQNIEQMILNAQKATTKASEVWRAAVKEVETAKKAVEYYRALDEHRRVMELREQKQIITEELKSDAAKKLQEKVKAQQEEYRAREQKAREYRHAREDVEKLRRKVGRDIKRLNTLRVRETDKKHVPQEFQALADAIMRTFTDSELSRLAFSAEKTASLQRTYRSLGEMESDFTYYWDDEVQTDIDNLVSLSEGYSALKKRGPGVPSYLSLEGVELEVEILQGVDNIVSNALNMIDMANREFLTSRQETFEAYANRTGENLVGREDHKVRKGALGKWQTILDESIRTGNMTPVYFFEHLQNPEIKAVFDEIRKGQSEYAKIIAEGKTYVQEMQVKHNYGKWVSDGKLKMKTGQGHTIELTREEAAELYALYKREQANKLYQTEHLLKGGFQYRNIAEKVSEDGKTRAKDNPHQLDAADMARISEWLTEEQKAYADALVGFLSTTMADYGNAASMSMYGYKKYTESYYIPFRTVAAQRMQKGDEGAKGADAGTGRLRNAGFTNKVQTKANATLYIGGITETVADHIHKMAAYSAMVQPIEDLKRLLNHKVVEGDGAINTIRALIGQKYGQAAEDYISQLLKDLNGATQSDNRASAFTDKMISAFKRGAVMASASVVLQQPTAMARAMAYIRPKYFAQNPFFRPSKSVWTEIMQYAGDAVIKDMGKFDIGMGLSATQYIMDEKLGVFETYRRLKADSKTKAGKAAFDRLIDRLTAAPGMADQWTWSIIWKAVKAEQAAENPGMDTASEAFLQKCGERFNDVIDHTQVYDSVLTKSNLMRSSNQLHKMATSFMSEPVLSLNMLYDAVMGKHGKKKGARIIGSVVASQVLAGAMAALVQAWNDDEDKRNWLEKYTDRATGNILSNINILGMIPYISDIVSMFEGYDVERPDMSAIADLIDYTKTFMKSFENGGPTWKQVENFAGTWANLLGIPAKNISREVRRTRNMIWNTDWSAPNMSNVEYVMMENLPGYSDKNTVYYDRIVAAELRGDEEEAEDLRTYMLTSKMVSEDKLTSGLKTAMKDRYIEGDVDDDTAIAYLQKVGAEETEDDAYWEVDKWKYARETGDSTANYRKYDDFFEAVESGTNLKATVQVYLDNGVSKTTLASQITSKYKPVLVELWKAGKKGEFADLQARILTAYEALGYDRAKKLKDIEAWLK